MKKENIDLFDLLLALEDRRRDVESAFGMDFCCDYLDGEMQMIWDMLERELKISDDNQGEFNEALYNFGQKKLSKKKLLAKIEKWSKVK